MVVVVQKNPSHSWWFHSHNSQRRSPWLQSTLSELDEKTMSMLKLIEEDADSFAKRAEMYYKKRPELINMVEDFYRTHRSLAERFDLLKSENKTRLITPSGSPNSTKSQSQKLTSNPMKKNCYDSYSDYTFESEESGESEVDDPEEKDECEAGESEVDDPEEQEETQVAEDEVSSKETNEDEILKLREEIEKLKEENRIQKEQLMEKDEEKREVIRQLSLSMEFLRENISRENVNVNLNKKTVKQVMQEEEKETTKKSNAFEFNKLKGLFTGKLFAGSSRTKTNLVAL